MMDILFFVIGLLLLLNFLNKSLMMSFYQNLIYIYLFIFVSFNVNMKMVYDWIGVYGDFSMDKISFVMILLVFWILGLMYLSSLMVLYVNYYIMVSIFMLFSLYGLFMSMDMLMFYLFFEVSLIPIILMILGWGGQPERLLSVMYLLMYTLMVSLPFLFLLLMMNNDIFSLSFFLMFLFKMDYFMNLYFYIFMLFIFMVKLPIYFVHLWLPKAHVEAPIFGSMVLAGILLKMGGYGLMRVFYIMLNLCMKYNLFIICFSFIGSILVSLMCLSQVDLKMLIAYSSVVHMGFMLCGSMMMYLWGMLGMLILMVGHGVCSSGLFCLLNFNYKRVSSRNLILNSGMINYYPKMSIWWFLFSVMNMSAPPSLNLVAEIYLIMGVLKVHLTFILFLFILSLLSSIYSIYIYSSTQHGVNFIMNKYLYNTIDEFILMIFHFIPLSFMFLILWLYL